MFDAPKDFAGEALEVKINYKALVSLFVDQTTENLQNDKDGNYIVPASTLAELNAKIAILVSMQGEHITRLTQLPDIRKIHSGQQLSAERFESICREVVSYIIFEAIILVRKEISELLIFIGEIRTEDIIEEVVAGGKDIEEALQEVRDWADDTVEKVKIKLREEHQELHWI